MPVTVHPAPANATSQAGNYAGPLTAIIGDSVAADSTARDASYYPYDVGDGDWFAKASILTGAAMRYFLNAGAAGNTTAQMLARIDAQVIDLGAATCIISPGQNDKGNAITFATARDNVAQMIDKCLVAGIRPILCSTPPHDTVPSETLSFNEGYRRLAQQYGINYVDIYSAVSDGAGSWGSSYSNDGVHPNAAAAAVMGQALADAVESIFPAATDLLPTENNDTFNLVSGGLFDTDTNADGLGDGWSAPYGTPSVSREAADYGFTQVVENTSGALDGILQNVSAGFSPGDEILFVGDVEIVGVPGGNSTVRIEFTGSTGPVVRFRPVNSWTESIAGSFAMTYTVPAGTTALSVRVLTDGAVGQVTKVGRVGVYNLTAP